MDLEEIKEKLRSYDGPPVKIMEVCGTHTAAMVRNGIHSLLSPKIQLISGPGCPVCVTVTAYIDKLVELSRDPGNYVYAFGDLLRVKGSTSSLLDARAEGAHVVMVYSPMEMLDAAERDPAHTHIFAAVGFETTTPAYALLLEEAERRSLANVRLLTSLKTMPEVIEWLCAADLQLPEEERITGFLAPGHVCAVSGYDCYRPIAKRYVLPFIVAGFSGEELLLAIYGLIRARGTAAVKNFYPRVVEEYGNRQAQAAVARMFRPAPSAWRGMGIIENSGLILREEYAFRDAGSDGLFEDHTGTGCRCADVLMGRITPLQCPLLGKACTPASPRGACMVSQEGACFNAFTGRDRM
jgi:hydrogenase expression/formation protein HypD